VAASAFYPPPKSYDILRVILFAVCESQWVFLLPAGQEEFSGRCRAPSSDSSVRLQDAESSCNFRKNLWRDKNISSEMCYSVMKNLCRPPYSSAQLWLYFRSTSSYKFSMPTTIAVRLAYTASIMPSAGRSEQTKMYVTSKFLQMIRLKVPV